MNTTSSLFKELSHNTISMLVYECFHQELQEARLLAGGLFNTTYLVAYGNPCKKAVLRVGPVNCHLLLPFEENLMQGEAYVYSLCEKSQIPCSKVLVCDTTKKLIDRNFMFVEYIESIPLSDETVPEIKKGKLYQQTGERTAQLHSITNDAFGRVSEIVKGIQYNSWFEFLYAQIESIQIKSIEHNAFDINLLEQVKALFLKHKNLLDTVTVPHLLHADLWSGNVLVKKVDGEYELAAIIDADRAIFGDIDYEFATPWIVNDDFIKGYQKESRWEQSNDEKSMIKKQLYRLFCHLTDAYVWKIEYNNEQNYQENCEQIKEICNKL